MTDANYRILGHDYYRLHVDGTLTDLDTVLARLNALENFGGLAASTWKAGYGSPATLRRFHLAVDHPTLGSTYLPEAIDYARNAAGGPAWTWTTHQPGGAWHQTRNLASDLGNLEMLEAVGRISTGSAARHTASWDYSDYSLTWTPSAGALIVYSSFGTIPGNGYVAHRYRDYDHLPPAAAYDYDDGDPESFTNLGTDRALLYGLALSWPALSDLETDAGAAVTQQTQTTWNTLSTIIQTPAWSESYSWDYTIDGLSGDSGSDNAATAAPAAPSVAFSKRTGSAFPASRAELYTLGTVGDNGDRVWYSCNVDWATWAAANLPEQTLVDTFNAAVAYAEGLAYTTRKEINSSYTASFTTIGARAQHTLTANKAWHRFDSLYVPAAWPDDTFTNGA